MSYYLMQCILVSAADIQSQLKHFVDPIAGRACRQKCSAVHSTADIQSQLKHFVDPIAGRACRQKCSAVHSTADIQSQLKHFVDPIAGIYIEHVDRSVQLFIQLLIYRVK